MKRLAIVAIAALAVATASADWADNFDSYNLGNLFGQGGWTGWGGAAAATGFVSNVQSHSAPQSQMTQLASDSVHTYSGYTSGIWSYRTWVYIPTDFQSGGTAPDLGTYFILMNTYPPVGNLGWSVQLAFDSTDHKIHADCGSTSEVQLPYVAGAWSLLDVHVNLTADWTQVYYNGTLLDDPNLPNNPTLGGGYRWTTGVFGQDTGGALNIAAVDLYANSSTSAYYDDMALSPIPEPMSALLLSVLALLRRR